MVELQLMFRSSFMVEHKLMVEHMIVEHMMVEHRLMVEHKLMVIRLMRRRLMEHIVGQKTFMGLIRLRLVIDKLVTFFKDFNKIIFFILYRRPNFLDLYFY